MKNSITSSYFTSHQPAAFSLSLKQVEDGSAASEIRADLKASNGLSSPDMADSLCNFKAKRVQSCAICLKGMRYSQQGTGSLPACPHVFCFPCIYEWSKMANNCPMCKREFDRIFQSFPSISNLPSREVLVEKPELAQEEGFEDVVYCKVCDRCDNEEVLLLCDACDQPYHTHCLNPPLPWVPMDDWYCSECTRKMELPASRYSQNEDKDFEYKPSKNDQHCFSSIDDIQRSDDEERQSRPRFKRLRRHRDCNEESIALY
eukprot:Nk52_evm5s162 gene=Nk52_evmTU5s162